MNLTTSLTPPDTAERWLRTALLADVAVTGANGLAYLVAATLLTTLLGPPLPLLLGLGAFLVIYAVTILYVCRARPIPTAGARFAIGMNLAWTAASLLAAVKADWLTPAGRIWDLLQAVVVLGFAVAQIVGLRLRSRPWSD